MKKVDAELKANRPEPKNTFGEASALKGHDRAGAAMVRIE